ncbi:hypothetical protein SAMN05444157_3034 [Frankineae bacterium MT45]|nr:hypothetical protein SAMN05444157_3034 [Frankineae bacterium MT45]
MNGVVHFEIQASQPERAIEFYGAVFGWTFEKQPMPIDYWFIGGAGITGGLLERPVPVPEAPSGTNAFTCSMEVADFDATEAEVLAHGGQVAMPKFEMSGRTYGYFLDPEGNVFGIFERHDR